MPSGGRRRLRRRQRARALRGGSGHGRAIQTTIARLDGSTRTRITTGIQGHSSEFLAFDGGTGTKLYVAGQFSSIGGVAASGIARWNGSSSVPLGAGGGNASAVFDDGRIPAVYIGGRFVNSGGIPARNIARWRPIVPTLTLTSPSRAGGGVLVTNNFLTAGAECFNIFSA